MEPEATGRSAEEVACRILALLGVVGLAHQREQATPWVVKNGIEKYFSTDESEFFSNQNPDEHQVIQFSWRAEAIVPMLWALQGLREMPALTEQFDIFENALVRAALENPVAFVQGATLRPSEELEEMEGHLYHQHWRVRDRDLGFNNDRPEPDDPPIELLDTGIVTERRYGMSWVVGDGDTWDDVPLDT